MGNLAPNKGVDLYALIGEHASPKYSVEDRLNVVMQWIVHGNLKKVAKIVKIPYMTLVEWKLEREWWPVAVSELRRQKQEELDGLLTGLIDNALGQVCDRIENGDTRLHEGEHIKVPMTGKDLTWVAGVLFDKRAALRGDPITHHSHGSQAENIQQLQHQFKEFANEMKRSGILAKPVGDVLDGETEEDN